MISKDNNVPEEKQEAAKSLAKKYYDLAKKYSDNLKLKPKLFIFTGLQGSGKSFCAKSLEKVLGIERIVTDKVRRKLYNLPESGPIPESKKPEVFSEEGIDRGYTELFNVAESELKGGNSCILDATFDRLKRREKAYTLANKHNAESMLIYCSAPDEVCIRRTSKKRRFSTAGPDTFEKYKGNFDFPTPEENPITIDCSRDGENIPKLMEPIIKYKMEGVKNE